MINNVKQDKNTKERSSVSKIATILLNRKEEDVKIFMKKREEQGKRSVEKNPRATFEVKYNRKPRKGNRKELEIQRSGKVSNRIQYEDRVIDLNNRRKKEFKKRMAAVMSIKETSFEEKKQETNEVKEWKEQVARVGTGYRVRKDEKDPRKRRFDVGYADLKTYKRKDGREAVVDTSNMGRTLTAKGKDSRVKVMNAVCDIEKRRPASEYTGSGILRKSMVGKLKLKPTKASGKE